MKECLHGNWQLWAEFWISLFGMVHCIGTGHGATQEEETKRYLLAIFKNSTVSLNPRFDTLHVNVL